MFVKVIQSAFAFQSAFGTHPLQTPDSGGSSFPSESVYPKNIKCSAVAARKAQFHNCSAQIAQGNEESDLLWKELKVRKEVYQLTHF